MSEISDAIQTKCLAFGDRIIKLNDHQYDMVKRPIQQEGAIKVLTDSFKII